MLRKKGNSCPGLWRGRWFPPPPSLWHPQHCLDWRLSLHFTYFRVSDSAFGMLMCVCFLLLFVLFCLYFKMAFNRLTVWPCRAPAIQKETLVLPHLRSLHSSWLLWSGLIPLAAIFFLPAPISNTNPALSRQCYRTPPLPPSPPLTIPP